MFHRSNSSAAVVLTPPYNLPPYPLRHRYIYPFNFNCSVVCLPFAWNRSRQQTSPNSTIQTSVTSWYPTHYYNAIQLLTPLALIPHVIDPLPETLPGIYTHPAAPSPAKVSLCVLPLGDVFSRNTTTILESERKRVSVFRVRKRGRWGALRSIFLCRWWPKTCQGG